MYFKYKDSLLGTVPGSQHEVVSDEGSTTEPHVVCGEEVRSDWADNPYL